jgi:hypothetical protein
MLYSRKTCYAASPGVWFSDDGEYEFFRSDGTWSVRYRAYWDATTRQHDSRLIGTGRTLDDVFAIAGRYYVHPVVPVDAWHYPSTDVAS